MCRMIAKVSSEAASLLPELEQCPNSLLWLAENGIQNYDADVRGNHKDGCGMAYIDATGNLQTIKRGKTDFWDQAFHDFAANAFSQLYIAHNRKTSDGLMADVNGAHPFTIEKFGQQLAFCHNGTIYSLIPDAVNRGTSDSEIFMEKLVTGLTALNATEVARGISSIACASDYSSMCGFLLSKNELYIWRIFNENKPEKFDLYNRYYTLYFSIRKGNIVIASEPLDNENWQLLPNKTLLSLKPALSGISIEVRTL